MWVSVCHKPWFENKPINKGQLNLLLGKESQFKSSLSFGRLSKANDQRLSKKNGSISNLTSCRALRFSPRSFVPFCSSLMTFLAPSTTAASTRSRCFKSSIRSSSTGSRSRFIKSPPFDVRSCTDPEVRDFESTSCFICKHQHVPMPFNKLKTGHSLW